MNKKRNWDLLKPIWIGVGLGIIGLLFVLDQNIQGMQAIGVIYCTIGIPLGWTFINQHKPQTIALGGTLWFWLLWNFLKLTLATFLGSLLIPYQLYKFYKSNI